MLATVEDLAAFTQRDLSELPDGAEALLELSSGVVADFCNKVTLQRITDDVVPLRGTYAPDLHLPGLPVESVSSVSIGGIDLHDWRLVRGVLWRGTLDGHWNIHAKSELASWGGPDREVTVTYTHGFDTPPQTVKLAVLQMAARVMANPYGFRSENRDNYSVTYAEQGSGVPGGVALTAAEQATLRKYRLSRS